MRLQDTQANCGPASLSNALAALGIPRSPAECEALCKTDATQGTSPSRLLAAIRAVGRDPIVISERRPLVALLMLHENLIQGRPSVLCVDEASHWVAAVGLLGYRILVADPADNELVVSMSRVDLAKRWVTEAGRSYGVVI